MTHPRTSRGSRRSVHSADSQILRLLALLEDGQWHTTKELARKVGHCFGVAKYKLLTYGYEIVRERHPKDRTQYRYRLIDSTKNNS